jgi:hypothetical protein
MPSERRLRSRTFRQQPASAGKVSRIKGSRQPSNLFCNSAQLLSVMFYQRLWCLDLLTAKQSFSAQLHSPSYPCADRKPHPCALRVYQRSTPEAFPTSIPAIANMWLLGLGMPMSPQFCSPFFKRDVLYPHSTNTRGKEGTTRFKP